MIDGSNGDAIYPSDVPNGVFAWDTNNEIDLHSDD
jgi:hypothetical protein